MQPTDQPSGIQDVGSPYVGAAERSLSGVDSSPDGLAAPERRRSVSIRDTRFPSGWVYVVAWDVVCQGNSDLSTMLCRSGDGDYFLRCRSGDQPDVAASIVMLSNIQAALWFDRLPIHFVPRDSRW